MLPDPASRPARSPKAMASNAIGKQNNSVTGSGAATSHRRPSTTAYRADETAIARPGRRRNHGSTVGAPSTSGWPVA
jgi:hypothetical protein